MPSAADKHIKRFPPPWALGVMGVFLLVLLLVSQLLPPGWWTQVMVIGAATAAICCGLWWPRVPTTADGDSSTPDTLPPRPTPAAPAPSSTMIETQPTKPAAAVSQASAVSASPPATSRGAGAAAMPAPDQHLPPWTDIVAFLPYYLVLVNRQGLVRYLSRPLPTSVTVSPGESCFALFEGNDQAALRQAVAQVQPGTGAIHLEANPQPAGGLDRWLTVDVVSLPAAEDTPEEILLVVRDETAAHVQDATLRHNQRMEAIGRLAAGVGHDFNNLLTVVQCNALLLLEAMPASATARVELEEIIDVVKRATKLTHQLLTFSRKQEVNARAVDLNEVARNLLNLLKRLVGEDIELGFAPDPQPVRVCVDDGQLEQVIMNLVVNARDAMPKGGRIMITTARQIFVNDYAHAHGVIAPGSYAVIRISDTGDGIVPTNLVRIFEPYFTTKSDGHGYGLGLSTTYGIIKNHGGGIACSSQPHVGTTFTIYLPDLAMAPASTASIASAPTSTVIEPKPATAPALDRSAPTTAKHTILVVEDEPSVREVVRKILTRKGYHLLVAGDAAEALKLVREHHKPIDLLFSDVVIPDSTGPELAQEIATMLPDIQVLFTSGYTDSVTLRHGLKTHTVHFLQKPYTATEMANRIAQILG